MGVRNLNVYFMGCEMYMCEAGNDVYQIKRQWISASWAKNFIGTINVNVKAVYIGDKNFKLVRFYFISTWLIM